MKVVVLKNKYEYENLSRKVLFEAFFAGYWDRSMFVITKDRMYGNFDKRLSSTQLVDYINDLEFIYNK